MSELVFGLIALAVVVLILRALGAWMLRIDEVISNLREISKKLDKIEKNSK